MNSLAALAIVVALAAGPALAEDCRSAPTLERQLLETPVQPFVARIEPNTPTPSWNVGASGGFHMAAPGLGDITVLRGAMSEAMTSCGLRVTWALRWEDGRAVSAGRFGVVGADGRPEPRSSVTFGATTFRLTPDKASQTAWLTVTEGGRSDDYRLDFPATAISLLPNLHTDGVRLEMMGARADGALVYAEFAAMKRR